MSECNEIAQSRDFLMSTFPERLKALRKAIGVSQDELAKKVGVSRAAIGYYENGDRLPDIAFLDALSTCTGCSVGYLLGTIDSMIEAPHEVSKTYELSTDQVQGLNKLLQSKTFVEFIGQNTTWDFFKKLDRFALGGFARPFEDDLIRYVCIADLSNAILSAYLTTKDSCDLPPRDEDLKALQSAWEEDLSRETERNQRIENDIAQIAIENEQDPFIRFRKNLNDISYTDNTEEE